MRRKDQAMAVLVALVLGVTAAPVRAAGEGTVKGTIGDATAGGKPLADAVVMVEGPPAPASTGPRRAAIDQHHETFVPHVVAVATGTLVDFPNSDPVLHNVYSASPTKKFDLGMYGQGETKSVTFDTPGVVRIGCNAHPKMEAFVVVHANPYFAVTDAQGGYTITGVPAGTYMLRVWHETRADRRVPVAVRDGQVTALDVKLEQRH